MISSAASRQVILSSICIVASCTVTVRAQASEGPPWVYILASPCGLLTIMFLLVVALLWLLFREWPDEDLTIFRDRENKEDKVHRRKHN
jgi:hypothetical protein